MLTPLQSHAEQQARVLVHLLFDSLGHDPLTANLQTAINTAREVIHTSELECSSEQFERGALAAMKDIDALMSAPEDNMC